MLTSTSRLRGVRARGAFSIDESAGVSKPASFKFLASPGNAADQRAALGLNTEGNTTFLRIYGILGVPGGRGGWSRVSTNQVTAGIAHRRPQRRPLVVGRSAIRSTAAGRFARAAGRRRAELAMLLKLRVSGCSCDPAREAPSSSSLRPSRQTYGLAGKTSSETYVVSCTTRLKLIQLDSVQMPRVALGLAGIVLQDETTALEGLARLQLPDEAGLRPALRLGQAEK